MHSLVVLTDQSRWYAYYPIVYPLYKWKKKIQKNNIQLIITNDKNSKYLKYADTAIIISRYFSDGWQNIQKRNSQNEEELINYLINLKKTVKQLVWYDSSDTTGTTDFSIIKYVDIFLKNQILKEISRYTEDNGALSVRQWLNETVNLEPHLKQYFPCPKDHLHKIKYGWNLGLLDHRVMVGKKFYSNYFFSNPPVSNPSLNRKFDFSLRGSLDYKGKNSSISNQRNNIITILKEIEGFKSIVSGERIEKKIFMKELAESKICISPFGWGEICYRDFEIFIAGSLMIKPSMNHLISYPHVFIENETYIPISWDASDLLQKIHDLLKNYSDYIKIAQNGQNVFTEAISDGDAFVRHLSSIIF